MEQTPRSSPRVNEISQNLGSRVGGNGWKIVAPHAKNTSNPDQFSSGLRLTITLLSDGDVSTSGD
jgi:hypothetical protein